MPGSPVVMAVDVGGTKVGIAAVGLDGAVVARRTVRQAGLGEGGRDPASAIAEEAARAAGELGAERVTAASLVAPGNPRSGESFAPNNPGWTFPASTARLKEALGLERIATANDVNAAALAEHAWGPWSAESLVHLNLGTGFAGGAVADGHLVTGSHGLALELGYLIPAGGAERGAASGVAPTEEVLSGAGLARIAADVTGRSTPAVEVLRAAPRSPLWSTRQWFADELAHVAANMAIVFDPDVVTMGGGLARFCEPFLPGVQATVDEFVPHPVPVRISAFPDDGSLLGGVVLGLRAAGIDPGTVGARVLDGLAAKLR